MIDFIGKLIAFFLWPFRVIATSALKVIGVFLGLAVIAFVTWYIITHYVID